MDCLRDASSHSGPSSAFANLYYFLSVHASVQGAPACILYCVLVVSSFMRTSRGELEDSLANNGTTYNRPQVFFVRLILSNWE